MSDQRERFEQLAAQPAAGIVREFWDFVRYNKKWWMLPLLFMLLLFGILVLLSGSGAAPFIYTLF